MIIECPKCELRYDVTGKPAGSELHCRCGSRLVVPNATTSASSLQCPNCGSPADPQKNRCDFCHTPLAVMNCPSCLNLQFSSNNYCSSCGKSLDEAARPVSALKILDCPRCRTPLERRQLARAAFDQCHKCGGLWLDHQAFERILDNSRSEPKSGLMSGLPPRRGPMRNPYKVEYLPCPECSDLMHRKNYGKTSGVILDVCSGHGIWFDPEELASILDFLRSGGAEEWLPKSDHNLNTARIEALIHNERRKTRQADQQIFNRNMDTDLLEIVFEKLISFFRY